LQKVQKILGLEGALGAPTPAVAGGSSFAHAEEKLCEEDSAKFRTAVCTMMYVAPDRPDCQFGIRELTKAVKEPTVGDMQALARLTRYLIQTKSHGIRFEPDENPEFLDCFSATDRKDEKEYSMWSIQSWKECVGQLLPRPSNDLPEHWRGGIQWRSLCQQ
jgi:hypothetical protein